MLSDTFVEVIGKVVDTNEISELTRSVSAFFLNQRPATDALSLCVCPYSQNMGENLGAWLRLDIAGRSLVRPCPASCLSADSLICMLLKQISHSPTKSSSSRSNIQRCSRGPTRASNSAHSHRRLIDLALLPVYPPSL